MTSREPGCGSKFDLPQEFLEILPADPFDQQDIARKITSIALSTRVEAIETETSDLHLQLIDKDAAISGLESQFQSLDASLSDVSDKIAVTHQEKLVVTGKYLRAPDITGEGIGEVRLWTKA